jgi:hypothetical protein
VSEWCPSQRKPPGFAGNVVQRDPDRIAHVLNESAKMVRDAAKSRVETGRDMNCNFEHPIPLLQLLNSSYR